MRVVDERTALVRDAARRSSTRTSATTVALALALAAGVLLVTANGTLRARPRAATRAPLGRGRRATVPGRAHRRGRDA